MFNNTSSPHTSHRLNRFLLTLYWGWLAASGIALGQSDSQIAAIDQKLSKLPDSKTQMSACFIRLADGVVFYERNAHQPLIPASNQKILTAAVALDVLGKDFTYDTALYQVNHNLILVGSGDPGLGDPELAEELNQTSLTVFKTWASELQSTGITSITGDILIDDGLFDAQWTHPAWEKDDLPKWYAAPVGGLNFNDNCVEISVTPTQPGKPVSYTIFPKTAWLQVNNQCRTGKKKPWVVRDEQKPLLTIRGECGRAQELGSVAILDPGIFSGEVLREVLNLEGIVIHGQVRRMFANEKPAENSLGQPLAKHQTSIRQVLRRALQDSQNLFAESLMKQCGTRLADEKKSNLTSWQAGQAIMSERIKDWGIDTTGMVIVDGSGLSRDNRISARQIVQILKHMHQDATRGPLFLESLSVSHTNGTLKKRMKDIPEQVYAKTGYLTGVRSLSGYVVSKDQQWYAFSVIFNNIPGGTAPYNGLHDQICQILATEN